MRHQRGIVELLNFNHVLCRTTKGFTELEILCILHIRKADLLLHILNRLSQRVGAVLFLRKEESRTAG